MKAPSESVGLTIREARPQDARALLAHVRRLLAEPDIDIPLEPQEFTLTEAQEVDVLADYAQSENSVFLVAYTGKELVGALNLRGGTRLALRHTAELGMSVKKEWRNRGVGSALMAAALAWARSNPVLKRLELVVYARNHVALRLYEGYGFKVEGLRQGRIYQGGEYLDDLFMGLMLD